MKKATRRYSAERPVPQAEHSLADSCSARPTEVRRLTIPLDGFSRWRDLSPFVPLCQESIRLRELKGRFPKRVQLGSERCVGWPNRELHRWFADPAGYRSEG
jgi:predicted DNA-binding transcriptional regulator AlpA